MEIWTTFTPSKVSWELTYIITKGKSPTSDWVKNIKLIKFALKKLKKAGIAGIRLVIFPSELTTDGLHFNWKPIERMLRTCLENKLLVDLCVGPFQYPNYPGIYLPDKMLSFVFDNKRCLDTTPQLWKYGVSFLEAQIVQFGEDKKVHGFHLANEWPDPQRVKGREKVKTCISTAFMLKAAKLLLQNTKKPISFNTNIEASSKIKIANTFNEIFGILGAQGKLGFDIYPSQLKWRRDPLKKLLYMIWPYKRFFKFYQKKYTNCEIYFAEVEAQPWGSGQSWYQLISSAENPQEKVLNYSNKSLLTTFEKYIQKTDCRIVSLWGADFWLAADALGVKWPLSQIKSIKSIS